MIEVGATDRDQQCASYTDEGTRSDAILQLLISAESVTSGFEDAQRHSDYIWSDEGVRSAHDQFFAWCPITAPAGYHFETLDELCTEWLQSSKPVPDDRCT
jgi:hypothetical protein